MNSPIKSTWHATLPHLLVGLWVLYLAITIWQHAVASVQVPWGDGLSYFQKAASFWRAIDRGEWFNPLNLFPTVRPPGTILMSYPFGFSADYHGFHFRSVFLPILSVVAAVYIAAGKVNVKTAGWWVAAIALLFSSLPMFYWLDWNEERWLNNGWGMVDNFQAGIAALAGAALVRSLATKSRSWLLIASLLACLTFLIKQSGLMVMGAMGLTWLIVVLFEWRLGSGTQLAHARAYALKGAAQMLSVYVAVVVLCLFSGYLSGSNFAWAMRALGFYREVAAGPSLSLFHMSAGEASVAWVIGIAVLFVYRLSSEVNADRTVRATASGLLVGSFVVWALGIWYWLVAQSGGQQIRYFYPFMLMGAVCAVPAALYAWPPSSRWIRWFLMLICFAPALNIACLLAAGDSPSGSWQRMTGVSVSVAQDREEVGQAYAFLDEVRKANKDVRVYFFPNNVPPHAFVFVGAYEKIARPELAAFSPVNPMDWSRGFVVRITELQESDYILTRKYRDREPAARFAPRQFDTFESECDAFDGWLSTLNRESGVEVVSDGRMLRLLRIVDRVALGRAIERFVSEHVWRPEFTAANQAIVPIWWSADAVVRRTSKWAAEDIRFGDIYKIHALSIDQVDGGLRIEAWWEELRHDDTNDQRYLFLHLIDSSGAILFNRQIALHPYEPPAADRKWRYSTVTFADVLPNRKIASLAFGVYQPTREDGGFLLGDRGQTDWGGKRTLVPLPTLPASEVRPRASGTN